MQDLHPQFQQILQFLHRSDKAFHGNLASDRPRKRMLQPFNFLPKLHRLSGQFNGFSLILPMHQGLTKQYPHINAPLREVRRLRLDHRPIRQGQMLLQAGILINLYGRCLLLLQALNLLEHIIQLLLKLLNPIDDTINFSPHHNHEHTVVPLLDFEIAEFEAIVELADLLAGHVVHADFGADAVLPDESVPVFQDLAVVDAL